MSGETLAQEQAAEVSALLRTLELAAHPSADLRTRAVAAVHDGLEQAEVARASGMYPRTLDTWLARARRWEPFADRRWSGRPPTRAAEQHAALRAVVASGRSATTAQHADALAARTGVRLSRSRVGRWIGCRGDGASGSPGWRR